VRYFRRRRGLDQGKWVGDGGPGAADVSRMPCDVEIARSGTVTFWTS
jgi:hypothetical protein